MQETLEEINDAIREYQMLFTLEDIEDARKIRKEIQELKNRKHEIQIAMKESIRS